MTFRTKSAYMSEKRKFLEHPRQNRTKAGAKGGKGTGPQGTGKGKGICWNFQNTNTCWRGSNCIFQHTKDDETEGGKGQDRYKDRTTPKTRPQGPQGPPEYRGREEQRSLVRHKQPRMRSSSSDGVY